MKPRVAIFLGTHGPGFGAERVLDHLLGATTFVDCVIAPQNSTARVTAESLGLPWIEWASSDNSLRGNLAAFRRFQISELRARQVDIVHAWHTRGLEWAVALGERLSAAATGTLHDDPTSPANGWVRRQIYVHSANRLAALAVVSRALDAVCSRLAWRSPRTVVTNGLPDEAFARIPPPDSRLRVGFLGLNEPWKGIDTIGHAISHTLDLPLTWELYGDTSPLTRTRVSRLQQFFPDRVTLHGHCSPSEIFSRIDILVSASERFDPYPTILLEAARAGLPGIATCVGGAPEIVQDGLTGLLIPPKSPEALGLALRRLTEDRSLTESLGRRARKLFTRDFQVSSMADRYGKFWCSVPF